MLPPLLDRSTGMRWFPAILHEKSRYFLPRGEKVSDLLIGLLSDRALVTQSGLQHWLPRVMRTMREEPTFWIAVAMTLPEGARMTRRDAARHYLAQVVSQFASGDAFLGVPHAGAPMRQRFDELGKYFATLPRASWIENGDLWLSVTGSPVSDEWKRRWPAIQVDDDSDDAFGVRKDESVSGQPDPLQAVARLRGRLVSLESAFDRRLHRSKLEAIRQLAYGLSHEINNPLANISTRAQWLLGSHGITRDKQDETLQKMVDQVYRAHSMIADLMFYANPPKPNPEAIDLTEIVNASAEEWGESVRSSGIRIDTKTNGSVWVSADRTMIQEAIRVLVKNAVEAIGQTGTIVLSLFQDDRKIRLHIADSGPGLSDEAKKHAFDPYYSGREAGRGLGMGLCRAYRIARLHRAEITIASGPAGCVATLSFPKSCFTSSPNSIG